ncbi:MAG: NAD(P)-dependent oxidoreductase [Dehalococcoidia bacterium]
MLSGEKVLVTGAAGRVAFPIARELAKQNEVHGMARFSSPADREKLQQAGIKTIRKDIGRDTFDDVPSDFTYVFHAAALVTREAERDWRYTFEVNAQAAGRLLHHCRNAKGFVHCSTGSQYQYQGHRPLKESDPPGIHTHNYSLSKIAAEAVVTWVARQYDIPAAIIRICSTYGPTGGAPANRLDLMVQGKEVPLHPDKPNYFNPIYEDDYVEFGIKALTLAQTPPLVVNWAGSETVSAEEYCQYMADLLGIEARFRYTDEAYTPLWPDITFMHQVLGRTKVHWKDGMRRMVQARYPDRPLRQPE